ncbi:M90 family metallopeptidase [Nitratifractor sp.]
MFYYLALMQFLLLLLLLFLSWQAWLYFRRLRLKKRIETSPFPAELRSYLQQIPHYRLLDDSLKKTLHQKILYFLATKEFRGVKITVTEEMKAVISFYACLMVLKIPDECYEVLRTILIYPSEVLYEDLRAHGGIYRKERVILEGQSAGDTVVIAWNDARKEAYHLRHHNVVVHELAHVLDFEDGMMDGVPPLERSRTDEWARVLYRRFQALQTKARKNRDWGKYALLGAYAATDEAEFFAVVTELYFQSPWILTKHFPDLYREWKSFFGLDTARLFAPLEKRQGLS